MISKFHYITQDIENFSHAQLAEFACKGGTDWIQLRVKNKPFDEWKKIAEETLSVCKKYNAKLIINDNFQIATEISADGVHLGKEDMNPEEARKIAGKNFIIGGTANTLEDANEMIASGVDYLGVGPFRYTETKKNLKPLLGLEGIKKIFNSLKTGVPVIAIGGIRIPDVQLLLDAGVFGIAVSAAINFSPDKMKAASEFINKVYHSNFSTI